MRQIWICLLAVMFYSSWAQAREVTVGFAADNAPLSAQDGSGLEISIVKAALKAAGHSMTSEFFAIKNLRQAIAKKRVDAIAGVVTPTVDYPFISMAYLQLNHSLIINTDSECRAKNLMTMQDCNIVTSTANAALLPDLQKILQQALKIFKKLNMVAQKNAPLLVRGNSSILQLDSQKAQQAMFWRERINAYIGDSHVFAWYQQNAYADAAAKVKLKIIKLAPEYALRVGFADLDTRTDFDHGLQSIAKSGELARLTKQYNMPAIKIKTAAAPEVFLPLSKQTHAHNK